MFIAQDETKDIFITTSIISISTTVYENCVYIISGLLCGYILSKEIIIRYINDEIKTVWKQTS